jgi:AcrR family transcriptional regulator
MQTKKQSENRRHTIVNAAIGCFIDKGFHATSMRDIAQAAAVSLGNLYNYFPGKESLIAEVAIQEQDELAPLLKALRDKNTSANLRVGNFLRTYSALCSQREWAVLAAECLAEIARNAELAPAFEENQLRTLSALEAAIEDGNAQGIFTPQVPAGIVAQLLLDSVESEAMRRVVMRRQSDANPNEALNKKLLQALLGI